MKAKIEASVKPVKKSRFTKSVDGVKEWWPVVHRCVVWVLIAMLTNCRSWMKATSFHALAALPTSELIWNLVDLLTGMLLAGLITLRVYTDTSLGRFEAKRKCEKCGK